MTLIPTLVTAPSAELISVSDMKLHLRVDNSEEDDMIGQLIDGAVAHLDGWKGALRRCIMPQTWSVDAEAGDNVLPFPDVTEARVDGVAVDVTETGLGPQVSLSEAATVEFDCALPDAELDRVRIIVKLLVGHWYEHREAAGESMQETPMAVDMLVSTLRWGAF